MIDVKQWHTSGIQRDNYRISFTRLIFFIICHWLQNWSARKTTIRKLTNRYEILTQVVIWPNLNSFNNCWNKFLQENTDDFCNYQYNSFMARKFLFHIFWNNFGLRKNWLLIQNRRKYGCDQIFFEQIETFKLFIL